MRVRILIMCGRTLSAAGEVFRQKTNSVSLLCFNLNKLPTRQVHLPVLHAYIGETQIASPCSSGCSHRLTRGGCPITTYGVAAANGRPFDDVVAGRFSAKVKGAEWIRCLRTGRYAMAMNTETLAIPHLGAITEGSAYGEDTRVDWSSLRSAELALRITVDGKIYRCTKGGRWTRHGGPRLIVSGRFLQRHDVTDLEFVADDGDRLQVEARLETVAWPDRLGFILAAKPSRGTVPWRDAAMEISIAAGSGKLQQGWTLDEGKVWHYGQWRSVSVSFDPVDLTEVRTERAEVQAYEFPSGSRCRVERDEELGCFRVDLDRVDPIAPPGGSNPSNDAMERTRLVLTNPTDDAQPVRLIFEKRRFSQRIGTPITGVSAVLRDTKGNPTGIPIQLSKNWHRSRDSGAYDGQWFHGITQIHLPAKSTNELRLVMVYGHWGGLPAASHAQLSLIGWGGNQLWEQSALGSWGESICYDPLQAQANSTITDVRPLMVRSISRGKERWGWTANVGGGDFFRLFLPDGRRVPRSAVRPIYYRTGPCLTEVTHASQVGDGLRQKTTVSLARGDDIVRATYRIRLDVDQPTDFARFVIFQVGCDTYNYSGERRFAIGNESGRLKEWKTQWGDNTYRTQAAKWEGGIPWASLHEGVRGKNQDGGAWANRGIVLRKWNARLGGKAAAPWYAERGHNLGSRKSSTFDILPPPEVARLESGDFIEATFEHLVVPQSADDYYGPSASLRADLKQHANTWKMIHREAADRVVKMKQGTLQHRYPDIRIQTDDDTTAFELIGGVGHIPVTFVGLRSELGYELKIDDHPFEQSVHGNDFWQTDYDPGAKRWSRTYNIPAATKLRKITFASTAE